MRIIYLAIAISLSATPLAAGPKEDAEYIIQQTMSEKVFAGALKAMELVISKAVATDLRKKGVVVSDVASFTRILGEEFMSEFTVRMQRAVLPYYMEKFSATQLAELASFYRSDTGQYLIKITPELTQLGAKLGRKTGIEAFGKVKGRLARRLRAEGITVTKDKNMMKRLLEELE